MTNKTQRNSKQQRIECPETKRPIVRNTRDAVESAIDDAKKDKETSWDSTIRTIPNRVAQWTVEKTPSS